MIFKELAKAAADIARDDCIRYGWITPEDDLRTMSVEDPARNLCELYFERMRDGVRLFTLRTDLYGLEIECIFNPDLRKRVDSTRSHRPNSRLAAHEAHWS
jgi:hypothetical protein